MRQHTQPSEQAIEDATERETSLNRHVYIVDFLTRFYAVFANIQISVVGVTEINRIFDGFCPSC